MLRGIILAMGALITVPVFAQLTYPECDALTSADFKTTELFNRAGDAGAYKDAALSEPTHMDVRAVLKSDGSFDHADIIFTERLGNVKYYDGTAKAVKLMGKISTLGKSDNGLMGVVFHPDYAKNRWIYLWYSPTQLIGQNRQLRLTRVTVKEDNTLDMASEKILINIKASKTDTWHSGGPMVFDAYGDLWGTVGNNTMDLDPPSMNVLSRTDSTNSAEWGSSNTASLRGGFWRIHPDSSEKGYSIPRGNFGEYWADQFEKQGKTAIAAQYRDPLKVLPEVYVKGERSNFSIAVHPTKRWLAWGTVNYASNNDEFNITDKPIFSGFPYYHNNNIKTGTHDISVETPKNTSPLNSGVVDLPPAVPGAINNLVNVAIGGPIYVFDRSLNSKEKFPPHFHNKWLIAGFKGGMWAVTLDTNAVKPSGAPLKVDNGVLSSLKARNYIQSMYGQDGALYVLNYDGDYDRAFNPGVMRVAYTGACKVAVALTEAPRPEKYQKVWLSQTALKVAEKGRHEFSLFDLRGNRVYHASGSEGAEYRFKDLKPLGAAAGTALKGVYLVKVGTDQGGYVRSITLM
jgi:glucose/arabinose dehydrogenase